MIHARRLPLLMFLVLAAAVLDAGCGGRGGGKPGPASLTADVSDTVRRALAHQQTLLAAPAPAASHEAEIRLYNWFRDALYDPQRRPAAVDSFFTVWAREPRHVLWAETGYLDRKFLDRRELCDSLLAVAAGADTTDALHRYLEGRRAWAKNPRAAATAFAAGLAAADPRDSLLVCWLRMNGAAVAGAVGGPDDIVTSYADLVPLAWATGGAPLVTTCWLGISSAARDCGRLGDALAAVRMASTCAEVSGDSYTRVRVGIELGRVLTGRHEHAAAEQAILASYELARSGGHERLVAGLNGAMTVLARATGDIAGGLSTAQRGLAMAQAADDTSLAIRYAINIGDSFKRLGELDSATAWFDRADALNGVWRGGDHAVQVHRYRAMLLLQLGCYAEAESLRMLAVSGRDAFSGNWGRIELDVSLALQGLETDRPDLAYAALARARRILAEGDVAATTTYDPMLHVELASAQLHAQQGEYHLADACLRAAEARAHLATSESLWYLSNTRGLVATAVGDGPTAVEAFTRCLDIGLDQGDPDMIRRSRLRLAQAMLAEGRPADAESLVVDGLGAAEYWTRVHAHLVTGMARSRAGRPADALAVLTTCHDLIGPDAPAGLRARVDLERGRALAALGRSQDAYDLLSATRGRLAVPETGEAAGLNESFNAHIVREVAEVLLGLLVDRPGLVGRRTVAEDARRIASWARGADTGRITGPRLEFFVGDERAFAWWTPGPDDRWQWRELPMRSQQEDLVAAVITDMSYPDREIDADAVVRLGDLLLSPLSGRWRRGDVLEIVPDGMLHNVPWPALSWHADGAPEPVTALAHGPLVLIAGPPAVVSARTRDGGLLAVGCDDTNDQGTGRLRQAEAEARAIAALWRGGPVDLRVGREASVEDLLAGAMRHRRAIHLSSHATVYEGDAGHTAIHMTGGDLPVTIPQLVGGVVDADLVFVSCCEGARRHRHPGKGVVSFAEAFLVAGADQVIASTVRVDDEATRLVAESFYRHWLGGKERAAALQAALLELADSRSRRGHPFYWAHYRLYRRPAG